MRLYYIGDHSKVEIVPIMGPVFVKNKRYGGKYTPELPEDFCEKLMKSSPKSWEVATEEEIDAEVVTKTEEG